MSRRRAVIAIAGVTLVALVLRAVGLGTQPLLGDDVLAGVSAANFVQSGWPGPTMWHHPRLRDLLVYVSVGAFGPTAWGLKAWSVLLGTLSVAATGWLVWLLSASVPAAALSAAIVALDPLHIYFSRAAINDVYLSFFPVAAIGACLVYVERRRPWMLATAGLLLGLGAASKWSVVFPVAASVALTLPACVASQPSRRAKGVEIAFVVGALGLLPIGIYLLTYWPWFGRGHDLAEFVRFHRAMAFEATTHTGLGTRIPDNPGELIGAWRWFLQPPWWVDYVKPIPGSSAIPQDGLFPSAVGNPLTWLATIPAAAWAAYRWLRARDRVAGVLLLLWLAAYLPFAVVPRPIWTNSAVAVVPFWAALVGWAAGRVWERARAPVVLWAGAALTVALLLWIPATSRSFGPAQSLVRALVTSRAFDVAYHPATYFYGVDDSANAR